MTCVYACFLTSAGGMLYAFVFDCEPLSEATLYEMDRDVFNHSNDDWNNEFMSFGEWIQHQEEREDRFHQWIYNISDEIGIEFAQIFDPECGAGIKTPDWVTGERE